jgi:hypothetical protein
LHCGPCRHWRIPPLSWVDVSAAVALTELRPKRGSTRGAVRRGPADCDNVTHGKACYCENVKNITVSVPDDVYRSARVAAAQRDTSVSALVVAYLEQLSGRMDEFARLEALQREVQAGIGQFRANGRLSRDEVHDRAVR